MFLSDWRLASPELSEFSRSTITELAEGGSGPPGELAIVCTTALGWRFDALAATLEMPFKDNAEMPDGATAWSEPAVGKLGEERG